MSFGNDVTLVGNCTRDPELRFTPGGMAVAQIGLAHNRKRGDTEEEVHFFDVTAYGTLAENLAETVVRGMRVVVVGRLDYRSWETQDGDKRSKVEVVADEVSPSLRWATAEVTKNEKEERPQQRSNGGNGRSKARSGAKGNNRPDYDEEPF